MMIEAYTAYHKANIEGKVNPIRAALDAVFEMQGEVVKDFVDMMDERLVSSNEGFKTYGGNYNQGYIDSLIHLTSKPEYIALKSSISPVSEDKKGEWKMPIPEADEYDWSKLDHGLYKIYWKDGGRSMASVGSLHSGKRWFAPTNWTSKDHNIASSCWNKVKDVKCIMSNADLNREEEPEQPTDTQDNDGWIEASTVQNITLQPQQKIEIKTFCQKILSIGAADAPWKLCGLSVPYSIIAYRIIEEPKKQTLEEFAIRNTPYGNLDILTPGEIISLISGYSEEQNKCK